MKVSNPWVMNEGFFPGWAASCAVAIVVVSGTYACHPPAIVVVAIGFLAVAVSVAAVALAVLQSRSSVINTCDVWGSYDKLLKFSVCPRCGAPSAAFNMGVTGDSQYVEYECMSKQYLKKATKYMIVASKLEPGVPGICERNVEDMI